MARSTVEILQAALDTWGITLTEKQCAQFSLYNDTLVDWNANRMNLTRLVDPESVAILHFLDSLAFTQFCPIPHGARLIDVGAGAGFPGLAIKILRPDIRLTLLEATAKKLKFCEEIARLSELTDVNFVHGRAEETGERREFRGMFDVATARAVASMNKLVPWVEPFLAKNGVFLAWKGPSAEDETREAAAVAHKLKIAWRVSPVTLPLSGNPPRVHRYVICHREV
ncbi:MAG TPA: 16S rRNA (guanine(527)-N(7))-methyltransferase RsmG [Capsulimonadaceae bacterium]|jgi:16S rRNA (guanine527-N7)-methyltransferase